jgi:hypothetical protein
MSVHAMCIPDGFLAALSGRLCGIRSLDFGRTFQVDVHLGAMDSGIPVGEHTPSASSSSGDQHYRRLPYSPLAGGCSPGTGIGARIPVAAKGALGAPKGRSSFVPCPRWALQITYA